MPPPPLCLGPPDADAVVLLLHGFGADASDLAGLVPALALPGVRFVLPEAPVIRATLSGGWPVQAWYDIRSVQPSPDREDPVGVRASAVALTALLQAEEDRGVPAARMVVAGFSQGGAMALYCGLRYPRRLAGIVGMSSYLVLPATLDEESSPDNLVAPVWLAHGRQDDVVPLHRGEAVAKALRAAGRPVRWQTWPMAHEICREEQDALRSFLAEVLER